MTNSQRLAAVRDHLRRWLSEQVGRQTSVSGVEEALEPETLDPEPQESGQSEDSGESSMGQQEGAVSPTTAPKTDLLTTVNPPEINSESILIRDGFYAGRTFEATVGGESVRATWFLEPDELKIRGPQGNVLAVFGGNEIVATPATDKPSDQEIISIPIAPAAKTTSPAADGDNGSDGGITKAA